MLDKKIAINILQAIEEIDKLDKDQKPHNWGKAKAEMTEAIKILFPEKYKDKDLAILTIQNQPYFASYDFNDLSDELRSDLDVVLTALNKKSIHGENIRISKNLLNDRNSVLKMVSVQGSVYENISEEFKADKEIALAAIKHFRQGLSFEYVPKNLKYDDEFIKKAVEACPHIYPYIPEQYQKNTSLATLATSTDPMLIKNAPKEIKSNPDVILTGLKETPSIVEKYFKDCISRKLRNNKEFMIQAINITPYAYTYAFNALKDDPDLKIAYAKNGGRFSYDYFREASTELMSNKEFVIEAVKTEREALKYASDELKADKEVVMTAVANNGHALSYASDELRNDKDVVHTALKENIYSIKYIGEKFQNLDFIMHYVENEGRNLGDILNHLPETMKYDKKIIINAFETKTNIWNNFKNVIIDCEDKELATKMLDDAEIVGLAYRNASDKIFYNNSDKTLILECASERIRNNPALLEGKQLSLNEQLNMLRKE